MAEAFFTQEVKGYVLTDSNGKRIRKLNGELTPFFTNLEQCFKYWRKELQTSPSVNFHKIKNKV
jgi:hypothetical protein